ncbi:cytochrome C [Bdellovibrio sp.]|uniref:cytochrome C n=1 Tax=Bdellovibrio TaxID=958 RepID=UPI003221550D
MQKMFILASTTFVLFTLPGNSEAKSREDEIQRGRYLVKTIGCNDCHTPFFGMKNGEVPEKDWLIGDQVGWKGPWGTTFPTNLRERVHGMSEADFVQYAKTLKTRPPMPWYAVNAMTKEDLRAMYRFIKSLGPSENKVPSGLPPGEIPQGPYMDMTVVMPK